MAAPILVTGGTGRLGRHVVRRLVDAGHLVRVPSRSARPPQPGVEPVRADLSTGDGLADAVRGVEVVVHLAGEPQGDQDKAEHLMAALDPGTVRHLVFVSVVGADRLPVRSRVDRMMFGYYEAQQRAEQVVAGSGLPWSTLRATQFHQSVVAVLGVLTRSPVVPVPAGALQPVDVEEVAQALVDLAAGEPAGLAPELAGPEVLPVRELLATYLAARGKRRLLVPVPLGGGAARAFRAGAALGQGRPLGRRTWREVLAETV